ELLFGVGDGRVHMLDSDVGTEPRWLDFFGGDVPLLAVTRDPNTQQPVIVVVNTRRQGSETAEEAESTLRLLDGAGQPLSDSLTSHSQITSLHVTGLDLDNPPDIFVARAARDIYAYSLALVEWWTGRVEGHVTALLALDEQRLLA